MKTRGFTLIELLAVVSILGILAIIVTPMVINTVEKSKKESFQRSIEGAAKAAKQDYVENGYTGLVTYTLSGSTLTSDKGSSISVDGKLADGSVTVYIGDEGNIAYTADDGTYYASKTFTSSEVTVSKSDEVNESDKTNIDNFVAENIVEVAMSKWKANNSGYTAPCYVSANTLTNQGYLNNTRLCLNNGKVEVYKSGACATLAYIYVKQDGSYSYTNSGRSGMNICSTSN